MYFTNLNTFKTNNTNLIEGKKIMKTLEKLLEFKKQVFIYNLN